MNGFVARNFSAIVVFTMYYKVLTLRCILFRIETDIYRNFVLEMPREA